MPYLHYFAQSQASSVPFNWFGMDSSGSSTFLTRPAMTLGTSATGIDWTPDGTYLAVASAGSPYFNWFKRNGDTLTQLPQPASPPADVSRQVAWDPSGTYLFVAGDSTPRVRIYKRTGDTLDLLTTDPGGALPCQLQGQVSWSSDGQYVVAAFALSFAPYFYAWKRVGDVFTRLANPASPATALCTSCEWSADGATLWVGTNSNGTAAGIIAFSRSGDVLTKVSNPPQTNLTDRPDMLLASADGGILLARNGGGTALHVWSVGAGNALTPQPDPAVAPGYVGPTGNGLAMTKNGLLVIAANANTNTEKFYSRSGSTLTNVGSYGPGVALAGVSIVTPNSAPYAPTLTAPANNSTVDRSATQRFSWTFSDPDGIDTQSKFDLQYRVGAGAWTTVTQTTANQFYDFAPNALAAGTYEWQVRTYDSQGVVGPWSASSFVTMANAPAAPAITDPLNGAAVGTDPYMVQWTAPTQTEYQLRKVADNAGSPDTSTVYYDSGSVVDGAARSRSVAFPVNDRYEHIQVRIKANGLWSSWASVRILASYTPPPVPTLVVTTTDASGLVSVAVTNPAPGAGEPAVTGNEIWRKETSASIWTRIAVIAANAAYFDYTAGNGSWDYQAVALATTGVSSTSETSTAVVGITGIWLHDPKDPAGTIHRFAWDGMGRSSDWESESALMDYVGRTYPVAEFGTGEREQIKVSLPLDNDNGDGAAINALIKRKSVLCYRDGRGRKLFVMVSGIPKSDESYGYKMDFVADAVDYTEAV